MVSKIAPASSASTMAPIPMYPQTFLARLCSSSGSQRESGMIRCGGARIGGVPAGGATALAAGGVGREPMIAVRSASSITLGASTAWPDNDLTRSARISAAVR